MASLANRNAAETNSAIAEKLRLFGAVGTHSQDFVRLHEQEFRVAEPCHVTGLLELLGEPGNWLPSCTTGRCEHIQLANLLRLNRSQRASVTGKAQRIVIIGVVGDGFEFAFRVGNIADLSA
jgi:hypothetical protein